MTHPNPAIFSRRILRSIPLLLTLPLGAQVPVGSALDSPDAVSAQQFPETALPVQWADFDGDGLDDALVVTTDGRLTLLQSQASGKFLDATEWAGLESITGVLVTVFQDYDGDGRADLFAGSADGRAHLMHNLGGSFGDVTSGSGIASQGAALSAHWMDYDSDGLLDLHLVSARANTLYHALVGGTFEPVELPVLPAMPRSVIGGAETDAGSMTGAGSTPSTGADRASNPADGELPAPRGSSSVTPSGPTMGSAASAAGAANILACVTSLKDAAGGSCIMASSVSMEGMLYPLSEDFFVDSVTGKVGIGTAVLDGPGKLTVRNNLTESTQLRVDAGRYASVVINHDHGTYGEASLILAETPDGVVDDYEIQWMVGMDSHPSENRGDFAIKAANNAAAMLLVERDTGNVGIGTTTPAYKLDVNGPAGFSEDVTMDGALDVRGTAGFKISNPSTGEALNTIAVANTIFSSASNADIQLTAGNSNIRMIRGTGFVGIGTSAPATMLDVDGAITIRGGADIVETFESSCGLLEPGTVVVIDPNSSGALMCSSTAYDTKVAGVVSGAGGVNPGLLLGQDDLFSGDTRVAMTGRVYVNCSTENGPILPGDRLTTASLEGHAMKVSEERPSSGSVIGKAMSSLESGSGLVLVLVNLQ